MASSRGLLLCGSLGGDLCRGAKKKNYGLRGRGKMSMTMKYDDLEKLELIEIITVLPHWNHGLF